ncbi:RUXE protein, partial [Regulus satrapa]|nr:RUXE protein [Regulus satrapa]
TELGAEGSKPLGLFPAPFFPSLSRLQRSRIQVWLYEQVNMRIEGCIIGFDEYMNLVLDDAEEIHSKTKSRKQLGR